MALVAASIDHSHGRQHDLRRNGKSERSREAKPHSTQIWESIVGSFDRGALYSSVSMRWVGKIRPLNAPTRLLFVGLIALLLLFRLHGPAYSRPCGRRGTSGLRALPKHTQRNPARLRPASSKFSLSVTRVAVPLSGNIAHTSSPFRTGIDLRLIRLPFPRTLSVPNRPPAAKLLFPKG